MNKNLSLAIKKAVRSYPTRPEIKKEAEDMLNEINTID